jgi:CHAT domain-containing protein
MLRANALWIASVLLALCLSLDGSSALSLPGLFNQPAHAQTNDEAALRSLVEQFYAAFARKDLAAYLKLWSEKSPDFKSLQKSTQDLFNSLDHIEMKSLSVTKLALESDKATARLSLEIVAVDAKTGQPSPRFGKLNRILQFVREDGAWRVWRNISAESDLAARLVELKTDAERSRLLDAEKELVSIELRRALVSLVERQLGQGNFEQAMALFNFTRELSRSLNDRAGVAISLNGIGLAYRLQSDYAHALEYFQQALALNKEIDSKEGMAASIQQIGIVQEMIGNYTLALDYFKQSLAIRETLPNRIGVANVLNSIGIVYSQQGDNDLALENFQKALKIYEDAGEKAGIANALNSIANVYYDRGNYALTLETRQKGLAIVTELGNKRLMATAFNNIGNTYSVQGSDNLALEYYLKGLALREELNDKPGVANSLSNIGVLYRNQGQYDKAEEYLQRSLKLSQEVEYKDGTIQVLSNLGTVNGARGRHDVALEFFQKSWKLNEEMGDRSMSAALLANIAQEYRFAGNYAEALSYSTRSATLAREIKEPDSLLQALTTAGKASRSLNRLKEAQQYFEEAIATTESLRSQVAGTELEQQRFLESRLSPYQELADLLVQANRPSDALTYAERAKARVLLSVLQNGKMDITKAMTGAEREEERRLRGEIVSLNTQATNERLKAKPDQNRLRDLNAQLDKARLNFETFQANLYAAHPELRIQRGGAQLVTLEQARELLGDTRTAVLEYMVMDKKSFLFVLTRNERQPKAELTVYTIDVSQDELEKRADSYRKLLAQRNSNFAESARALYELLVAPARRQLEGKTKLVIVPDGPLWNLPFQALQPADARYVIDDYAIDYAPSLTVLREMTRLRTRKAEETGAASTLLAFGNPSLSKQAVERSKFVTRSDELSPLPEAEREVKTLEQVYSASQSRVYTGAEAQEGRAKTEAGKYRIIHFATHGILNDASPMYSYLVLTKAENEAAEDGLLEAWEIMSMTLHADLVVLSACDTARGRIGAGEGVLGLSWAFFVAGAPTTLVSQWKVESASTAQLMLEFHRSFQLKLKTQRPKPSEAEALRQAVIKLREDERYRHPFYWAGFVVVGDGL